jgi:hypothetical protein
MDDAEARAILREHDEDPPKRGKLGDHWHTLAEGYQQATPPDYDGGVTDADFGEETEAEPPPELETVAPERPPRRVRSSRPPLRERLKAKDGKGKAKVKHKRISVAPVISEAWLFMGGAAQRIDVPLGRCLQMQSPVAGEIMEDIVKGTAGDRILQPFARAEDKARAVAALLLPPALVVALEQAQMLDEDRRKQREAILYPMLIQSMMLWERVAAGKMETMMARAEADAPARERAEQMARLIFGVTATAPESQPETVGV